MCVLAAAIPIAVSRQKWREALTEPANFLFSDTTRVFHKQLPTEGAKETVIELVAGSPEL